MACWNIGLMGMIARTAQAAGGRVIGVIPKAIHELGFAHATCDELIVTDTMRERKDVMDRRSDAFIALPGGFGTLDEILEILSLKQLNYHNRPIVFLNTQSFFTPLLQMFEHVVHARFAKTSSHQLYYTAPTVTDALRFIQSYQPSPIEKKWP